MTGTSAPGPLIVAGIDGSHQSKSVLTWASHQAEATGGRLRVVLAWKVPELLGYEPPRVALELSEAAEKLLAELVAAAVTPGLAEAVVKEGSAVRVLLREAQDATLLVLGRHGHGHDDGKPLGSVTQACLMQSPCPVVVVPN